MAMLHLHTYDHFQFMMNEVTNSTLSDFYLADGTDLTARKTEQMFRMVTHKREQKD